MTVKSLARTALAFTAELENSALIDNFGNDLMSALAIRPRCLSPKYFYDETGSALFDRICELKEYYPTRTEISLLTKHARDIAKQIGRRAEIVEFGAGSMQKIRILLDAIRAPARYLPVDISGAHLAASARALQRIYPKLPVMPVVADYTGALSLPDMAVNAARRIGFFPGSTIGNLSPLEALAFLKKAAKVLQGGALLIGVDLVKDPSLLHAAYNDSKGVTASFNLNLLVRANRELCANFDIEQFYHSAFYNAPAQRIEMHLMSRCAQQVRVGDQYFVFTEGETIHTENSYKFTIAGLQALAKKAGFQPATVWTDDDNRFSLHWLEAPAL
ncbi:L-histidine N(alpha)-methyltransferase [Candidimonas sp. SYP-B2681]|nr:L-histidine N(alpha)-methyltransferase [Candidimonas sp. SYP-B2681]